MLGDGSCDHSQPGSARRSSVAGPRIRCLAVAESSLAAAERLGRINRALSQTTGTALKALSPQPNHYGSQLICLIMDAGARQATSYYCDAWPGVVSGSLAVTALSMTCQTS